MFLQGLRFTLDGEGLTRLCEYAYGINYGKC